MKAINHGHSKAKQGEGKDNGSSTQAEDNIILEIYMNQMSELDLVSYFILFSLANFHTFISECQPF